MLCTVHAKNATGLQLDYIGPATVINGVDHLPKFAVLIKCRLFVYRSSGYSNSTENSMSFPAISNTCYHASKPLNIDDSTGMMSVLIATNNI